MVMGDAYPGLALGVRQEGHVVGVWHRMADDGGAEHSGQVSGIHLGVWTLGHSVQQDKQ